MKPAVLLSPRNSNIPLINALGADGAFELITFMEFDQKAKEQFGLVHFDELLDKKELEEKINRLCRDYEYHMQRSLVEASFPAALSKYLPSENGFANHLSRRIQNVLPKLLPTVFFMILGVREVLRKRDVRVCVIHDSVTWQWRSFGLAAKQAGVPVLHLPHAPCTGISGLRGLPRGYTDHAPYDRVVITGANDERWHLAGGVPKEKLALTGHPMLDGYPQFAADIGKDYPQKRTEILKALNIDPESRVVSFMSEWVNAMQEVTTNRQTMVNDYRVVLEAMARIQESRPGPVTLLVKLHPNLKQHPEGVEPVIKKHEELAAEYGLENVKVVFHPEFGFGTREILCVSDVVLSKPGSVICEALFMGAMVVLLGRHLRDQNDMMWSREIPNATTGEELFGILSGLLDREPEALRSLPPIRETLEDLSTYNLDGRAIGRVRELVYEMAGLA